MCKFRYNVSEWSPYRLSQRYYKIYIIKHSNHNHRRCYLKEKIHEKNNGTKKLNTTEPCGFLLLDKDFQPHLYVQWL